MAISSEERKRIKDEEKKQKENLIKTIKKRILEYLRQHIEDREKNTERELYKQALLPLIDYWSPRVKREVVERCFVIALKQLLKEGIIRKEKNPDPLKNDFYTIA